MTAAAFQKKASKALHRHFAGGGVRLEWPISEAATDAFRRNESQYSPRVDIAVGPFNIRPGNARDEISSYFRQSAPGALSELMAGLKQNQNPRCSLAIEVVYSGSSKHVLGDFTNASMMGLYGLVVASERMLPKAQRIHQYVVALKDVKKYPAELFSNLVIISAEEFLRRV